MTDDVFVSFILCVLTFVGVVYYFGYYDRFPYFGRNCWRKRPFFQEVYFILLRKVQRHADIDMLPKESVSRLENTVDKVLQALARGHQTVEVNLPEFNCGPFKVDLTYKITRDEVVNIEL